MINTKIYEKAIKKAGMDLKLLDFDCNESYEELLISNCILSKKFAKAFWPDDKEAGCGFGYRDGAGEELEDWEYHLQQIVILSDEEKLKYLEGFLKEQEK